MKTLKFRPVSLSQKYAVVERVRELSQWGNGLECLFRGEKCVISDSPYNAFQVKTCERYETVSQMQNSPLYLTCADKLGCEMKLICNEDDTVGFKAICTFDAFFYIFLDTCLPREV